MSTAPQHHCDSAALSADRRSRELAMLTSGKTDVDLLVIGGGVTGAGIALDAASRGLTTVLLERQDLAFGTSRWSSKLAHGGLRYLATGNVGIARRSAVERHLLLTRTAPHLTRPIAQIVPVFDRSSFATRLTTRLGFIAGDALTRLAGTSSNALPPSNVIDAGTVMRMCPGVQRNGLHRGILNWDCQLVDDARLVTAIARTAAAHGASILTRSQVDHADGSTVDFTDTLSGQSHHITARAVVNATGVWAGELSDAVRVHPSRGTHLVVSADAVGNPTGALTIPIPGTVNRYCFLLPEDFGRVFIGITDIDAPGDIPDVPDASDHEIDFLLSVANSVLSTTLSRDDILGTFSGLRPLLDTGEGDTADLSREHAIRTDANGLLTVTGGKLTEYRLMAEQVVDRAIHEHRMYASTCKTRVLPLVGAQSERPACDSDLPDSIVHRFGSEARHVVESSLLDRPLEAVAPGLDVTRAEFSFHVTHEGALTVDDIVDRRSRIGLVDNDRRAALATAEEALAAAARNGQGVTTPS